MTLITLRYTETYITVVVLFVFFFFQFTRNSIILDANANSIDSVSKTSKRDYNKVKLES